MRKITVSRMRERYAQTVLTFQITYIYKQGVSGLVDITAGGDFLGLCDH